VAAAVEAAAAEVVVAEVAVAEADDVIKRLDLYER